MPKSDKPSPAQIITDMVICRLEQGVRPWTKPWATGASQRPLRACGTPYSGINCLFLWAMAEQNGFHSRYWMTYKQAQQIGGQVRKGEKSSPAIFYKQYEVEPKPDQEDDDGKRRVMRCYHVFNACQIDGLPEKFVTPEIVVEQPEYEQRETLEAMFASWPLQVRHAGTQAYYSPQADIIQLPNPEKFFTYPDYAATRCHESIHATGHKDRLNREFGKRFGDKAYSMEELCAETGSFSMSADLGLPDTVMEGHAAYIGHWLEILRADNTAILKAAAKGEEAVNWLKANAARASSMQIAA